MFTLGDACIGSVGPNVSNKVPLVNSKHQVVGIMGITTDITHQKEVELDLKKAKEAAEAATQAKMAFIANMSHDLRTPLAGVIGMSESLEYHLENPERKQEAHLLSQSGAQLLNMFNEILDDIRAGNANEINIQEETFDVHQCIQGLIELEAPTTTSNHLGLQCDIDATTPRYIVSDRKKIHHILLNLLGNAIKFTKIGHITIQVKCLDRTESRVHLQFGVADTGIGIPKKLQKKVFERFFRVDPSYKGRYEGYGLGLHIVQSYVSLLGGHITLTSKKGVGTTFNFDLQCRIGHKEGLKPETKSLPFVKPVISPQNNTSATDLLGTASINKDALHFLLVEDNATALKALESIVSRTGWRFTSVVSGQQALELAKSMDFDLIITDIGLPDISGNELAYHLRCWESERSKTPVPIVGLTGHAQETVRPECIASEMNDVFTKPANVAMLKEIVNRFVIKTSPEPVQDELPQNQFTQPGTGKLGLDLPDTENQLFKLEAFPVFDEKFGLQQIPDLPVLLELLKTFISDKIQIDIHQMKQAYDRQNWIEIVRLAHKIKGGALYIGTRRLQCACQYLERYYKAGHRTLLDKLYHQLINVNQETMKTLKKWISKHI